MRNSCLIMHKNKGINCHVLFRTIRKKQDFCTVWGALHLYSFFDDQKEEKLPVSYSLRSEEGTMSCWCTFSLCVPLFLSVSVCLYISYLFLSSPNALTCFASLWFCNSLLTNLHFKAIININLSHKFRRAHIRLCTEHMV